MENSTKIGNLPNNCIQITWLNSSWYTTYHHFLICFLFCAENTRTVKLPKFVAIFLNLSSVLCVVSDERDHDQGFSHNSQIILGKNRMHWYVLPGKNYLIWPKRQTPLFNSSWQTQFWMTLNFFLQNLCVSSFFYVEC